MVLTSIGLEEIPQKSVLLIEEDLGSIKSVFIQRVGFDAIEAGKKVLYISTKRSRDDVLDQMSMFGLDGSSDGCTILGDFKDRTALLDMCYEDALKHPSLPDISEMDLCIVDTFTSLFIDEETRILVGALNSLVDASRYSETTFLLAADTGILTDRSERIMRSIVDGIIQFRTTYTGDKINRFINIPKLKGVPPIVKMIPFYITGDGISIDTRERVGRSR
jgi:KaiC/GvpD/RAD55 family RecA-like ATPase